MRLWGSRRNRTIRHGMRRRLRYFLPYSQKSFTVRTASIGETIIHAMNIVLYLRCAQMSIVVGQKGEPMSDLIDRQAAIDGGGGT